jgi:hypothetical protein
MFAEPGISRLFLTGYILAFIILNLVAYLISSFYQKKFDQPSPRNGFIAAIACAIVYAATVFISVPIFRLLARVQVFSLLIGSTASIWSAMALYYTMKRVRK